MSMTAKEREPWDEKSPAKEVKTPQCCPWCGGEMRLGHLLAKGGGAVWWVQGEIEWKSKLIGPDPNQSLRVDDEGLLFTYKTAWYCPQCEKMAIDAAGMCPPYGSGEYTRKED